MSHPSITPHVLASLREQPMTVQEIARHLGTHITKVRMSLTSLLAGGRVTRQVSDRSGQSGTRPYVYEVCTVEPARGENHPIAKVWRNGTRAREAANRLMRILAVEHEAMLVLASDYTLYAITPDSERANAVCEHHPEWLVGTYTDRCDVGRVAMDIRDAARGMA